MDRDEEDLKAEVCYLKAERRWNDAWMKFNSYSFGDDAAELVSMLTHEGFDSALLCDLIGEKLENELVKKLGEDLFYGREV